MKGDAIRIVHYELSELVVRVVVRTDLVESALVVSTEPIDCALCHSRAQPFTHHGLHAGDGGQRAISAGTDAQVFRARDQAGVDAYTARRILREREVVELQAPIQRQHPKNRIGGQFQGSPGLSARTAALKGIRLSGEFERGRCGANDCNVDRGGVQKLLIRLLAATQVRSVGHQNRFSPAHLRNGDVEQPITRRDDLWPRRGPQAVRDVCRGRCQASKGISAAWRVPRFSIDAALGSGTRLICWLGCAAQVGDRVDQRRIQGARARGYLTAVCHGGRRHLFPPLAMCGVVRKVTCRKGVDDSHQQ